MRRFLHIRSGHGLALTGSVAVVVLSGCGSAASVPSPTTTGGAASPPPALATLFVTAVPTGFAQQADTVGDTGPSNLAKAARDDGQPGATAALVADGFIAGYQRLWAQPNGTYLVVYIYRFATAAGTAGYEQRGLAILTRAAANTSMQPLAVPAISGATGLTGTEQGHPADTVDFTKGDYLVQVAAVGAAATPGLVLALAGEQFAAIP